MTDKPAYTEQDLREAQEWFRYWGIGMMDGRLAHLAALIARIRSEAVAGAVEACAEQDLQRGGIRTYRRPRSAGEGEAMTDIERKTREVAQQLDAEAYRAWPTKGFEAVNFLKGINEL